MERIEHILSGDTADALSATAKETHERALVEFYSEVDQRRDVDVMHAAVKLTQEASATLQARVFALRHLLALVHPGHIYHYGVLTAGSAVAYGANGAGVGTNGVHRTPGCISGLASDNNAAAGTPLPADFEAQILTVLGQLATHTSAPSQLRNVAECGLF